MFTQQEREFVNWTKGATGLVVTKVALCDHINTTWKKQLNSWERDEILHLPNFLEDIASKQFVYGDAQGNAQQKKQKRWKIECHSQFCQSIFDRLRVLHQKESERIVWNPAAKDHNSQSKESEKLFQTIRQLSKRKYVEKFDEKCIVCKQTECPFERFRQGIPLFDQNKKEPTDEKQDTIDEHFWQIANMYMFRGDERNKVSNSGPEDTDAAIVFKMMKNCKLFTVVNAGSDEVYDNLIEVRNFLMHAHDHRMTTEALDICFKRMKELLTMDTLKDDKYCKLALFELSKLEEVVIITSYLSLEDKELIRTALYERQQSLEFDITFKGNLKDEVQLKGLLEATIEKRKEYTAEKDKPKQVSSEDKQKQDSNLSERDTEPKSQTQRDTEPKSQSQRDTEPKSQSQRDTEPKSQSQGGAATATGATTGAVIGSIAGPPGAIIGATIGAIFGKLYR